MLQIRKDFYDYSNENSKLDFVAYVEDMGRIYDSWQMTLKHVPQNGTNSLELKLGFAMSCLELELIIAIRARQVYTQSKVSLDIVSTD